MINRSNIVLVCFFFVVALRETKGQLMLQYKVTRSNVYSTYVLAVNQPQSVSAWIETENPKPVGSDPNFVENPNQRKDQLFKDFKARAIYCDYRILQGTFYLRDTINLFNWELIDSTRKILGYNCLMAKTAFRGRNFTVFYTRDIPVADGPWKFNGLPGLILYAFSNDGSERYIFECVSVEKRDEDLNSKFSVYLKSRPKGRKLETWDEFKLSVDDYVKKYVKRIKSSHEADGDTGYTATIRVANFIEVFDPALQKVGVTFDY
jgi:GLPGLI family protein